MTQRPNAPTTLLSLRVLRDGMAALDARAASLGASRSEATKDALGEWLAATASAPAARQAAARIQARRPVRKT